MNFPPKMPSWAWYGLIVIISVIVMIGSCLYKVMGVPGAPPVPAPAEWDTDSEPGYFGEGV